MESLLGEIKRRKVFQVAAVYAVVAWLLVQVITLVETPLSLPDWTDTLVIVLVIAGFPLALVLSWVFDMTPQGIVRTKESQTPTEIAPVSPVEEIAPPASRDNAIAVLPFDNMSPDSDNAYFADGLTEELISDLSKLESLRVISRTSAMSFKGVQRDVGKIARELNVRYIVEGSVRRAGDALRITAQLIDADSDAHLWAEKYSGTVEDIFDLQERLSHRIVEGLRLKLTPNEERQLFARPIPDIRAYDYYLRAITNIWSFDGPSIKRSIRDLNAAIEILGDNVLLLRGLGMAFVQLLNAGHSDDMSLIDNIEDCARRIARLDENDAGSYLLLGLAQIFRSGFREAVIQLREAYRRDPSDSDNLWLGVLSLSTGQMDFAGGLLREQLNSDPLAPLNVLLFGYHHFFAGEFDEAANWTERSLEVGPEVLVASWTAVRTFIAAGKIHRAEECAAYLRSRETHFTEGADLMLSGLKEKSEDMPEASVSLRTWASRDAEWSQYLSDAYAFGGDERKSLEWLEIALELGFMNHAYLSLHDPFIRAFRDLPEWRDLLQRVRQEQLEFESKLASGRSERSTFG